MMKKLVTLMAKLLLRYKDTMDQHEVMLLALITLEKLDSVDKNMTVEDFMFECIADFTIESAEHRK